MPIVYAEYPDSKTLELTLQGRVSRADYDGVIGPIQAFIDRHGTIKVLETVESFSGFDPTVLIPGLRFDIRNMAHISHVAVVSDIGWFSPLIRTVGALVNTQLRLFALKDAAQARVWLDGSAGLA